MKILLLAPASSIHTARWVRAFAERNHKVFLTSLPNHKADKNFPVDICEIKYLSTGGIKGYYLNAPELKKYCKRVEPDIINVHFASGYGTLARITGLHPMVLNVWGSDIYEFPNENPLNKLILKSNINHADSVASTSNCMADELRKVMGEYNKEVTITPFGVDTNLFKPLRKQRRQDNCFSVGTIKAFSYLYGIDCVIKAFALFVSKWKKNGATGRQPFLFICGKGEDRKKYIELAKGLGVEDYVRIEGFIPHKELPELINSFDVCCFGSRHESFGVSAIEAMACEVPVIVTDADGFKEVTIDGYTGYIVRKEDPEAMSEKLWTLYNDENLRIKLGQNGREHVKAKYSWDNNVTELENLLKKHKVDRETKKCILHIPYYIDAGHASGSQIRPFRMKAAFENLGYDVDFVSGYGTDRKKLISSIKRKIGQGVKYDFMYAECSTMPTLLTEKNHLPRYPRLDFEFFAFCKKNKIPIGLFYRDIYWKFPAYQESVKGARRIIAAEAYKYDLRKYDKLLSKLFVPSIQMVKYIGRNNLSRIAHALPPGSNMVPEEINRKDAYYKDRLDHFDGSLRLFYVGGIGKHYRFEELVHGVSDLDNVYLTICCRENEWRENADMLKPYINERINIIHKSGDDLAKYYRDADICLAYFQQDEYRKMAMPIKLFEYLSFTIPILTTVGTAAGNFVKENGIGWCIEYGEDEIRSLLSQLRENYNEVVKKHEKSKEVLKSNTWESRAMEAAKLLTDNN